MSTNPWIWCEAILTIIIFSYLWKENPLYRLAEHIFVGLSVGYLLCLAWFNALEPKFYTPFFKEQKFFLIIPFILGLLMLTRFSKKFGWLAMFPIAFLVALSGYRIPAYFDANILKQIQATINVPMEGGFFIVINSLIILVGTLSVMIYFCFSIPHKGPVGFIAKFGILILMISFGASFGYTVMARISLLIGRLLFLYRDWLGVIS